MHYAYSGYRIIQNQITGGIDTDVPYHYSSPPPPNFRVITADSVSYNFSLHNKFPHTTRTGRLLRFCAFFISSCLSYRGGKELFRIKVPSLPYDPTFLQKNRLGALPLRTLIRGGISKVWLADKWVLQVITVLPPACSFAIWQNCLKTHSGFLRAQALKQSGKKERVLGRERKPQSDGVSSLSQIKQRSLRGTSP